MKIRVTGILVKNDTILLLDQDVNKGRSWSLPGGKVEEDESLELALKREMKEETGLDVNINRLLYICDFITEKDHVLHITFQISEAGGSLGEIATGLDTNEIRTVKFIPISDITNLGFSKKFQDLITNNFPGAGSYMGPKSNIGL